VKNRFNSSLNLRAAKRREAAPSPPEGSAADAPHPSAGHPSAGRSKRPRSQLAARSQLADAPSKAGSGATAEADGSDETLAGAASGPGDVDSAAEAQLKQRARKLYRIDSFEFCAVLGLCDVGHAGGA
jgi:hypothetical protein